MSSVLEPISCGVSIFNSMKQYLSLLFALFSTLAVAQVHDETFHSPRGFEAIDALAQRISLKNADTLTYSSVDSISNEFNVTADSLHFEYRHAIAEADAETDKIDQTIDSLERLELPTRKYKNELATLSRSKEKAETKFNEKLNALKSKTIARLNTLELSPEHKERVQKLTQRINEVSLDNDAMKLSAVNIAGSDLRAIDAIGNVPSLEPLRKGTDMLKMPNVQPPGEVSDVTEQIREYHGQLVKIPNADVTNTETLQKTIESQASKVDGIKDLQKQSGVVHRHKTKVDELKDLDNGKKKAVELARKAAVDHFAGKQEELKAAIEKISKYKQKYSSVSSIKDLPKRPPNAMKGKPFIERLMPGLYLQYQQENFYLVDVNPYAGYKVSGRLTAGLGWNHRYAYDRNTHKFHSRSRIYGPRGYVDFKLGKGFIAHVEGESMNSFVPSTLRGNPDTGHREWVWSFMTGLKKEYKIYKNLKGTALIQYNWLNRYYKAPYVDRLNSRIGFEYTIKKAPQKKKLITR